MVRTRFARSSLLLTPLLLMAPALAECDPQPAPPAAGTLFSEEFARPSGVDRFEFDVHFRDPAGVRNGPNHTWSGDHNMACNGPTTQRTVHAHAENEFFWYCAPNGSESGHLMSSMGDIDGYTILSFAPRQAINNVSQVCWDVNLTDLGGRKWTQVLVVSDADVRRNGGRLDYISPVTQDVDETAVPLPPGSFMYQDWDHAFRLYQGQSQLLEDWARFTTSDKARRYRHCITDNGNGTVTVTQERDGGTHSRTVNASLPDGPARVIFQDDNYTPLKDGPIAGFTWHWDNIEIR